MAYVEPFRSLLISSTHCTKTSVPYLLSPGKWHITIAMNYMCLMNEQDDILYKGVSSRYELSEYSFTNR